MRRVLMCVCVGVVAGALLFMLGILPAPFGRWLFWKMVASTGFVGVAVVSDGLGSAWGRAMTAGTVLCWLGDLILPWSFLWGLSAFLLAHLAFSFSFFLRGVSLRWCAGALAILAPVGTVLFVYLWPHITRDVLTAILAYAVVISLMVAMSVGAFGKGGNILVPLGAVAFYVSDIFVARGHLGLSTGLDGYIGVPLYYAGMVMLASSVVGAPREVGLVREQHEG